jgi:hypothetical protein
MWHTWERWEMHTLFWSENLKHRWKVSTRMDIKEIGWIHMAEDRDQWQAVVDMVMNLWVP